MIVINADAKANYQSVINVMEAAREAGLVRVTFATQRGEIKLIQPAGLPAVFAPASESIDSQTLLERPVWQ